MANRWCQWALFCVPVVWADIVKYDTDAQLNNRWNNESLCGKTVVSSCFRRQTTDACIVVNALTLLSAFIRVKSTGPVLKFKDTRWGGLPSLGKSRVTNEWCPWPRHQTVSFGDYRASCSSTVGPKGLDMEPCDPPWPPRRPSQTNQWNIGKNNNTLTYIRVSLCMYMFVSAGKSATFHMSMYPNLTQRASKWKFNVLFPINSLIIVYAGIFFD